MLSLTEISPFAIMTFSLCPIFYLVSTLYIKSKILLFIITIVGNGVFYGVSGAIIGLGFALFQRATARDRNEEGESEKPRKTGGSDAQEKNMGSGKKDQG